MVGFACGVVGGFSIEAIIMIKDGVGNIAAASVNTALDTVLILTAAANPQPPRSRRRGY